MKRLPVILFTLLLYTWGCKNKSTFVQSESSLAPDPKGISINPVIAKSDTDSTADKVDDEYCVGIYTDEDSANIDDFKSLNDIRFENWTEKDWLDNDYIRTVRRYLDSYLKGDIEDVGLDPYKEHLASKFGINYIYPSYGGGVNIRIIFIDMPDKIFNCWVYSTVDPDKEKVLSYWVHYIKLEEEGREYTKEDIFKTIKEHPELKLW
ncbi:MAG: hypothetical protein HDS50_01180 [Bacteroides sp.]|nr:hypothetical protein [Bacteroides sp.]